MHLERIDENYILSFGAAELTEFTNELQYRAKRLQENEKNKYQRIAEIISEAKSEHPLGDKDVVVDAETIKVLNDICWENSRIDENQGYWVIKKNQLREGMEAVSEIKLPNFRTIFESVKAEYNYRIKTVVELSDEQLTSIENILQKYDLVDMSKAKKTIMQAHPLDFADVQNAEVSIYDVVTHLPVSSYILQQELRAVLGIPEKYIVVRGENDPLEIETARIQAEQEIEAEAEKDELEVAAMLSTDEEYPESEWSEDGSELYGNEYNSSFLTHLAQIAASRKTDKVDAPAPLFSWLQMDEVQDEDQELMTAQSDAFNDGIEGADGIVRPVHRFSKDAQKEGDAVGGQSAEGNMDDNQKTLVKFFKNNKGETVAIDKTTDGVRKGD